MSKSSAKRHRRKSSGSGRGASAAATAASDTRVYIAAVILTAAAVLIAVLLDEGDGLLPWPTFAVCVGIIAWFINTNAWAAYRGRAASMPPWKQALARLPLRCVGYGSKGGKPLEAAHDVPAVRRVVIVSTVVSLLVVGGLVAAVLPGLLAA